MDTDVLIRPLEEMYISTLSLTEYFPKDFKIYEFSADNETVSGEATIDDVSTWLRAKENKSFVFQCLLCCQEMPFKIVFNNGNSVWNRSHLLTTKHKINVSSSLSVGLLFTTSRKFVMCKETDYLCGRVFDAMKQVKRRDIPLMNEKILDQVFCNQYNMYTFNKKTNALVEFEYESDIVRFIKHEVRPLFSLYCLFCNVKAQTYTKVVEHLCSRKHRKKMGALKGNIVSIRDYNILIVCDFGNLSSFIHVTHLNSYLEEIIIGGEGTTVIAGCHSKEGKSKPNNAPIRVEANPVELPNGIKKNESIMINTRFIDVDGLEGPDIYNDRDKLLTKKSFKVQRNVTIYEFSSNSFKEHYADNLIFAMFGGVGCGVYCTRCEMPIYSSNTLRDHMSSEGHNKRIRNNDQIGFMCHTCNIFFLALKGEFIAHIHSSKESKNIKKLFVPQVEKLSYQKITSLNEAINSAYSDIIQKITEPVKFCCLVCFDLTKTKLSDLSGHEEGLVPSHNIVKHIFSFCDYCNVIYITNMSKEYFVEEHFATHLNCNGIIPYKVYWLNESDFKINSKELTIDKSIYSSKDKPIPATTTKHIEVRASKFISQLVHPGVSCDEFHNVQKWTENSLANYIFSVGGETILFWCLMCNFKTTDKNLLNVHLFTNHGTNTLLYIKFCDVCRNMLFSETMLQLQRHFLDLNHTNTLLNVADLELNPVMDWTVYSAHVNSCNTVFASKSQLYQVIMKDLTDMKALSAERDNTFRKLTDSIRLALIKQFTNIDVEFHGSRLSGLALNNSNVDVSINVGNENFAKVESLFQSTTQTFQVIRSLPDCEVPIIQLLHLGTNLMCNISLTTSVEKYCSMLVKVYIDFDQRVHMLLAAIRHWASLVKIKDGMQLPGHTINWLVLFYLMQPDVRVIPPVSYVVKAYGGLEGVFAYQNKLSWSERKVDISKNKNYLELTEGFFHYYSLMNFKNYKLCPYDGLVIPNKTGEPMYLEDPVNRRNIFGKNMVANFSRKFRSLCSLTLNMTWRIQALQNNSNGCST